MSLLTRTQETAGESETRSRLTLKVPDGARILIVCEDDSDTERLKTILQKAGFMSECAKSITAGGEAAKSGRFQVVVSTPLLRDGSWRRLTDIANQDRKSTRLNSSHRCISYAVFCLKKKKT